jgi:hypothetical protein
MIWHFENFDGNYRDFTSLETLSVKEKDNQLKKRCKNRVKE